MVRYLDQTKQNMVKYVAHKHLASDMTRSYPFAILQMSSLLKISLSYCKLVKLEIGHR